MSKPARWIAGLVAIAAAAALGWWVIEDLLPEILKVMEREEELEKPVVPPRRASRSVSGELVITLDEPTIRRLALKVEPLSAIAAPAERKAYGQVLNAGSLIKLQADLAIAEAELAVARPEFERLQSLHQAGQNASLRSLQAAQAQFVSSQTSARAALQQLSLAWGKGIAGLPAAERGALIDRVVKGEQALARVHLPPGEALAGAPAAAAAAPLGLEERRLETLRLFEAPETDARLQGQSFILLLNIAAAVPGQPQAAGLPPGTALIAYLQESGEPQKGILLPRAAILRHAGKAWVYQQIDSQKFSRREVHLDRPMEKGWFTTSPFREGDRVVASGAQALLSEELKSSIAVEEEE